MTNTTTTPTDQLDLNLVRYFEAWNETDPPRRLAHCQEAFMPDARYVDPFVDATGPQQISDFIGGMQGQFPDHRLERTTAVDLHHDVARFGWAGCAPDGAVAFAGIDVVIVADDGRIAALAGFVGDLG
jgi:SnoaL-like domain